ncbi:MAG: Rne/Rng family ribonuclease [Myxococcales bacterium]|nr:MAG: Rne/Rng family ribonuclease [Myxococcales bacterium]
MGQKLIINATPHETRVALVENGATVELYIERKRDRGYVGDIFLGKVIRVLPGMQAAFVDVGLEKAAFLYVSDIFIPGQDVTSLVDKESKDTEEEHSEHGEDFSEEGEPEPAAPPARGQVGQIEELLKEGQELLVQVAKDPIGTKGCRITTHVSLPGRYLVYMPYIDHVGISRRIVDEKERARLRELVEKIRRPGSGFIVRTVAEGVNEKKLKADMTLLMNLWKRIQYRRSKERAPIVLHYDMDLVRRAARDLITSDVESLAIDDRKQFEEIRRFIKTNLPNFKSNVELYEGPEPIFDHFGIEMDINRALGRKVWLKSGGYIIIDQAEALTAIDVNTGRYVGKRNLEETILKTNLEAVREIAYQLRLRNIGGIIIIDFIDMEREVHREKVYNALEEALRDDRAKTNILKISEFGLVEMTRKRIRESLGRTLCEPCFYCDGKGYLKSKTTICYEIFREVKREIQNIRGPVVTVNCHPEIYDMLVDEEAALIAMIERQYKKKIQLRAISYFHMEQYEVIERSGTQPAAPGPAKPPGPPGRKPHPPEKPGDRFSERYAQRPPERGTDRSGEKPVDKGEDKPENRPANE